MTCIIGIKENGKVWLGSDKLCSSGNGFKFLSKDLKQEYIYWNDKKEFLIGLAGNPRIANLLFCNNKISGKPLTDDPLKNIVNYLIPELQNILKNNECYMKYDDGSQKTDSWLIIGYKGGFFIVDPQFFVYEPIDNFCSIGSGSKIALGCLEILDELDYTPEQKIETTMKIVSKYITSVSEEFDILSI